MARSPNTSAAHLLEEHVEATFEVLLVLLAQCRVAANDELTFLEIEVGEVDEVLGLVGVLKDLSASSASLR